MFSKRKSDFRFPILGGWVENAAECVTHKKDPKGLSAPVLADSQRPRRAMNPGFVNAGAARPTLLRNGLPHKQLPMTAPVELFGRSDLTIMQRFIFAMLCGHADRSGRVLMSQREIARSAATDPKAVRRALNALKQAGVLIIERQGQNGIPQIVRLSRNLEAPRAA